MLNENSETSRRYFPTIFIPTPSLDRPTTKVFLTDRSPETAGLRFRYTGPVWPVTGRNRTNSNLNSNLNSNFSVQPVRTGIPAG